MVVIKVCGCNLKSKGGGQVSQQRGRRLAVGRHKGTVVDARSAEMSPSQSLAEQVGRSMREQLWFCRGASRAMGEMLSQLRLLSTVNLAHSLVGLLAV